MKTWQTPNSEYLYKTPFGNLRKDKCRLPNGMTIDDYYVSEFSDWVKGNSDAAVHGRRILDGEGDFGGGMKF